MNIWADALLGTVAVAAPINPRNNSGLASVRISVSPICLGSAVGSTSRPHLNNASAIASFPACCRGSAPWITMSIGSKMLLPIQPIVAGHGTPDPEAAYRLKAGDAAPGVHFVFQHYVPRVWRSDIAILAPRCGKPRKRQGNPPSAAVIESAQAHSD